MMQMRLMHIRIVHRMYGVRYGIAGFRWRKGLAVDLQRYLADLGYRFRNLAARHGPLATIAKVFELF